MSLARRSVHSSIYNVVSQTLQIVILLFRSVMLARLLSPEVFGLYTFAQAIIYTTQTIPSFGLGSAYIHHSPETEHPDAPGVYLTLIAVFSLIWAVLLAGVAALLLDREQCRILWILIGVAFVSQLVAPAQTILARRVRFQRLAILALVSAALSTPIALLLAWKGAGIWSLLSVDIVSGSVLVVGLYVLRPVWRPRPAWSLPIARYFLKFGRTTVLAGILVQAIDRLDDLWTGYFLGSTALGFYSRAYTFANYPRRVLADPINAVAMGTYAEVKHDRKRLSQGFFRFNALVVRMGLLFAGILFLISPEFVHLILGEKWLPMLGAFRLMIAYTVVDPIKFTVGHLFISVGRPDLLARVRAIQLVVLVVGLVTLGPNLGIVGVASAATIMVVVGTGILLWKSHQFVDFSLTQLFGVPIIALLSGALGTYGLMSILGVSGSYWLVGLTKLLIFMPVYVVVEFLGERHQILEVFRLVKSLFLTRAQAGTV
jgi:O-antigen/teichoic acid export membrane protein